jgi:hypothetical protein
MIERTPSGVLFFVPAGAPKKNRKSHHEGTKITKRSKTPVTGPMADEP